MGALMLLAASLVASIGPWLWIGLRRGNAASAWGALPPNDYSMMWSPSKQPRNRRELSETFRDHLRGRPLWGVVLLLLAALVLHDYIVQKPQYFWTVVLSYALCWLISSLVLFYAWWRVGRCNGVQLGLLAMFFLTGGILGVVFAALLEIIEETAWMSLSKGCNLMFIPMTPACNAAAATMWILTPGLMEETGKAIWLFWRLRRTSRQLPGSCCFGLFPASHSYDCGCWYKLAPTPYHVILTALAAGAGFECLENIMYVFVTTDALTRLGNPGGSNLLSIAELRCVTSGLHVAWTGLIGFGLARKLFLPEDQQPSLLCVVLPSIILHGLYDYALAAMPWVKWSVQMGVLNVEGAEDYNEFFVLLLLATSLGSCLIVACLAGLSCCGMGGGASWSCCCYPGFWEHRYGVSQVAPSPASLGPEVATPEAQAPLLGPYVGTMLPAAAFTEQGVALPSHLRP